MRHNPGQIYFSHVYHFFDKGHFYYGMNSGYIQAHCPPSPLLLQSKHYNRCAATDCNLILILLQAFAGMELSSSN